MKPVIVLCNVIIWIVTVIVSWVAMNHAMLDLNAYDTGRVIRGMLVSIAIIGLWITLFALTVNNIRKDLR